jgi:hypothetical protein
MFLATISLCPIRCFLRISVDQALPVWPEFTHFDSCSRLRIAVLLLVAGASQILVYPRDEHHYTKAPGLERGQVSFVLQYQRLQS